MNSEVPLRESTYDDVDDDSSQVSLTPELVAMFACPVCRQSIRFHRNQWYCRSCDRYYQVRNDQHDFFVDPLEHVARDIGPYTERFRSHEFARTYARNFKRDPRLRWRTLRELNILEKFLESGPGSSALNIPCGGGRLSSPFHRPGMTLIEADSSPEQLQLNQRLFWDSRETIWVNASAFNLPLNDESVDTVACVRLSHHLRSTEDRERLLSELIRVARERVIFTFRNRRSLTSVWRRLRGREVHTTVMAIDDIRRCAERNGARLKQSRSVSMFGARHTYVLLEKDSHA